jgi:hypothetical protein
MKKESNKTAMKNEEKERLKRQYFAPLRRCTDSKQKKNIR